ncbi:MAG: ABC transporter permease, partial [Bacteroidota bacterium]|nr:ABC transporter permease [Bacteroidota bacterium]
MLKNYFKAGYRNLWRNKLFSAINILGLAIGISASVVIFLITWYEFSYDRFEPDRKQIYRVVLDVKFNGMEGHSGGVQAPLAGAIPQEVTGVKLTVPVMQFQSNSDATVKFRRSASTKEVVLKNQPNIIFTNPQYFSLVPYQWVSGSSALSLKDPFTVVLTESRAHEYFPSLSANEIIGKEINYHNDFTATVSGIVKDLPTQSVFSGKEFISYATINQTHLQGQFMMDVWNDWMAYSQLYIKLSPGTQPSKIEAQLKQILNKNDKDANRDAVNTMNFHLQPLSDVHFNYLYKGPGIRIAHKPTLYGLLAIAAFLLLLGGINFINLTTAHATQRAKEIGIRKTMGSSKRQLIFQFLTETFLITSIATIISICLTPIWLTTFSDYIPNGLSFNLMGNPTILLSLLLLTLLVSFIAGIYPALILSRYKPAIVLKGQSQAHASETRQAWTRKALTVTQFAIAQFFIIGTIMVSKQINYSLNTDLGFNKEGIITFDIPRDTVASHTQQLLNEIDAVPGVEVASSGFFSPSDKGVAFTNVSYAPKKDLHAPVQLRWGNPEYLEVYGLKLLAGRNVAPSDTFKEFLINDTYAKMLGFNKPEEAIGKKLTFNNKKMPIVGVMRDFHDQSTHSAIFPLVFTDGNGPEFHVRLKPNSPGGTAWKNSIQQIQVLFHQMYPSETFDYKFYDDTIASMYKSETQTGSLLTWATGLAILISCLGLLGLVMYTIQTRTKEIGVRKILGATARNIISILSKDIVKLVVIAFLIASPLAWLAINKWLENFTFRTSISWWVFLLSGMAML